MTIVRGIRLPKDIIRIGYFPCAPLHDNQICYGKIHVSIKNSTDKTLCGRTVTGNWGLGGYYDMVDCVFCKKKILAIIEERNKGK